MGISVIDQSETANPQENSVVYDQGQVKNIQEHPGKCNNLKFYQQIFFAIDLTLQPGIQGPTI